MAIGQKQTLACILGGLLLFFPSCLWAQEETSPYVYNPAGKRDPFLPLFMMQAKRKKEAVAPKTPLQRYELGQLKLVGVIWQMDEPKALVEDSAGLGFVVTQGTLIGSEGGVVKRIEPDRVVVEEEILDFYGKPRKREIPLVLVPEEVEEGKEGKE